MATVGQIIYNLEDYNSSNGYISTRRPGSSSQFGPTVYSGDFVDITTIDGKPNIEYRYDEYYAAIYDIYSDIVGAVNAGSWQKMGIQAPPGTRIMINDDREILIGKTGVYELNEDVMITKLYFIKPKNYLFDSETTNLLLSEGKSEILAAETARSEAMNNLPDISDEKYYDEYIKVQKTYATAYEKALSKYSRGINGVYTLPDPKNPDNPINFKQLYNIIIDYVTE